MAIDTRTPIKTIANKSKNPSIELRRAIKETLLLPKPEKAFSDLQTITPLLVEIS
jgi:hypothetical protein